MLMWWRDGSWMPKEWNLAVLAFAIVAAIVFATVRRFGPPDPPLLNGRNAIGCYSNPSSHWIELTDKQIKFGEKGLPPGKWLIRPGNQGIFIETDMYLAASPNLSGRYALYDKHPGWGRFLSFVQNINGIERGVFDETELYRFEVPADDQTELIFQRTNASVCKQASST